MSIASVISSIETNVSNAYTSIGTKGGTIPANKNIANLAAAIDSISAGSGGTKLLSTKPMFSSVREPDTFYKRSMTGISSGYGAYNVWSDGDNNIYHSGTSSSYSYQLDLATYTWTAKTWSGTYPRGEYIWTDGENIYYSRSTSHYKLNKATNTWSSVSFTGLTNFNGYRIWTDGENIYHFYNGTNYVLDKTTRTWSLYAMSGLDNLATYNQSGDNIWTDGENIYLTAGSTTEAFGYKYNKTTNTWSSVTFTGHLTAAPSPIWTDGENTYYSSQSSSNLLDWWVLDKENLVWSAKTWYGIQTGNQYFTGSSVIYIGSDVVYSNSVTETYVLIKPRRTTCSINEVYN